MTEDDKELLRLAAKAGAIDLWRGDAFREHGFLLGCGTTLWNPITSDAQNRRLQIKLRIGLVPQEEGAWVCLTYNSEGEEIMLSADDCPNLAVVKAAAEIGRKMS